MERKHERAGDFIQEISCGLGFVFLISAWIVESKLGISSWAYVLYFLSYLFGGQEGVKSAYASLKKQVLDVDILMVLAALGAAIVGAPFEGALLLFLFSFSNVLQSHAMARTQRAIESLLKLRPDTASVIRDGKVVSCPVEDLIVGEIVMVKPGEQIPADGLLTEGDTYVDEASLTGESMPVAKHLNSALFAGSINQTGGIEMKVTKRSEDSALARMVNLVAEAQTEKSKTQRFLEKAEQWYALGVIVFTILVFLIPWLMQGESFSQAFYRAMTVMVVASPCALIISTPATVLSAIGGAARKGILIKGGSHLERAATIHIVALDKTGTLTHGKPALKQMITLSGRHDLSDALHDEMKGFLRIAAALEDRSEHPLARAILATAEKAALSWPSATNFQSITGKGAQAWIEGETYRIGSERWFDEMGATHFESLRSSASSMKENAQTQIWLGKQNGESFTALAIFSLADTIRKESRELVVQLKQLGVKKVIMLTGDHHRVAQAIAGEIGIDEFRAELLPEDKLRVIGELKKEGSVMMVGDGVNDAPALAKSDLGLAMGGAGTDVAMETADVVLMGDRLENIPLLLRHAQRARRVLIQNLLVAIVVIVVLVIAALGFALPLPIGVIGHEGSTVLVCLNGLRLLLISHSDVHPK